jgi:hypothetical protein
MAGQQDFTSEAPWLNTSAINRPITYARLFFTLHDVFWLMLVAQ